MKVVCGLCVNFAGFLGNSYKHVGVLAIRNLQFKISRRLPAIIETKLPGTVQGIGIGV